MKKYKIILTLKRCIFAFAIICLFTLIGEILDTSLCPVFLIFKTPCPSCGVTRSLVCLLKLDFKGYLSYNPMAFPLAIAFIVGINYDQLKNKRIFTTAVIIIAVINFMLWCKRAF